LEKMMSEPGWILTGAGVGVAVGLLHFGLLYATLRRLEQSERPHWLALGSFAGRLAVTTIVFFLLVRDGQWERGLAFLVGFVAARMVLVKRWKPRKPRRTLPAGTDRSGIDNRSGRSEPEEGGAPLKYEPGKKWFEERTIWK
jgi:F1F0 ATPase subunit 2